MKYALTTRQLALNSRDRRIVTEKLFRLSSLVKSPMRLDVVLSRDTRHQHGEVMHCNLTVRGMKRTFHAERGGDTVPNAVDAAVAALRAELDKRRDLEKRHR